MYKIKHSNWTTNKEYEHFILSESFAMYDTIIIINIFSISGIVFVLLMMVVLFACCLNGPGRNIGRLYNIEYCFVLVVWLTTKMKVTISEA